MPVRFAPPRVVREARADGGFALRSPLALPSYVRCLGDHLVRFAREAPSRAFLGERDGAAYRTISYAEAHASVRAIAQGLLDLGARPSRPVMLLSDNAIDHALVQLAAMHVGVPAAPISPAYSLQSRDHAKLRDVAERLDPSVIYASDGASFATAIASLDRRDVPRLVSKNAREGDALLADLARTRPSDAVDHAFASITSDTIAKVLFTSGSTGSPKGVVNTHRMMCSNQAAIAALWPFLDDRPPVVLDWLPWSHTFGGNHNFNMVLAHGGTLFVDDGRPTPQLVARRIENLRLVSPTLFFDVPRGFDSILPALEGDASLRASFVRDLDLLFYAAAALPPSTWKRLEAIAGGVPMVSAWGSTETSPLVTSVHFPIDRAGVIGLPAPGCSLAFVPVDGGKLEMRVDGPNVTPGYWARGGSIEPIARDALGYLPMGDAGRLEDPNDARKGVVFDGRTAENFKLTSGTWVAVGPLRVAIVAACAPYVQDAVIAGHDRDEVCALLIPNVAACADVDEDELARAIGEGLAAHRRAYPHASAHVARAAITRAPLSIDAGEITDKGYVNQRAVLARRAAEVEALYATPLDPSSIVPID